MAQGFIRQEVLVAAQEVAREKGIDKERVLASIEEALTTVAHLKYGEDTPLRVAIDRKTGEISLFHARTITEKSTGDVNEIGLEAAHKIDATRQVGETVEEKLPHVDFERVPAQVMRQAVTKLIREAAREKEYADYHDKVGEIVTGTVKSVEYGNTIVSLGQAEGVLTYEDLLPRERFHPGERVRAYVREVRDDPRSYQIFLSRTVPEFIVALFKQEVPEVYSGVIELKRVARDPGSRAKIGVASNDPAIDPVGPCVGVRGDRVQAVTKELKDERIDVIRWTDNPFNFLVNAMTPASVAKIVAGDKENHVQVIVPDDQLSLAIGRRGQNVRLASKLTGLSIDLTSESDHETQRADFTNKLTHEFVSVLNIDDVTARFLIAEDFESLEDIALTELSELSELEGIDETLAKAMQDKAQEHLAQQKKRYQKEFIEAGGSEGLATLSDVLVPFLEKLANAKIFSVQDLADLSGEELLEISEKSIEPEEADALVMLARNQNDTTQGVS